MAQMYWREWGPSWREDHWGYCGPENGYSTEFVNWVNYGSLIADYTAFAIIFYMDLRAVQIANIPEKIGIIRNIFHWLMTWPTLLMYNLVQVFSSIEGSLRGESVVSHEAAKKENIGQHTAENQHPPQVHPDTTTPRSP